MVSESSSDVCALPTITAFCSWVLFQGRSPRACKTSPGLQWIEFPGSLLHQDQEGILECWDYDIHESWPCVPGGKRCQNLYSRKTSSQQKVQSL